MRCYTLSDGVKSYLVKGCKQGRNGKKNAALFQPLNQLEITSQHKANSSLSIPKSTKISKNHQNSTKINKNQQNQQESAKPIVRNQTQCEHLTQVSEICKHLQKSSKSCNIFKIHQKSAKSCKIMQNPANISQNLISVSI